MQTIADKLQTIKDATARIKGSIIEKGGTIDGDISTWYSAIDNLETGESDGDDVIFYNYDGSILYSYSANKFLTLTEMPALPVREGLICQEWNWSFDNAREYVSKYGKCYIGATYITDDGKTRFYLTISEYTGMGVTINVRENSSATVIVDWGDGSPTEAFGSKTRLSHTFSNVGDYCVTLDVLDGEILLGNNTNGAGAVGYMSKYEPLIACKKVEIGKGVKGFTKYALAYNAKINCITIPNTFTTLGDYSFDYNVSIKHVTIPRSVDVMPLGICSSCWGLISASLPDSISSIGNKAFSGCEQLCNVTVPMHVVSIGSYAFQGTYISDVVIPDSITTIGDVAFDSDRRAINIHVGSVAVSLNKLPWSTSNDGDVNRIIAYGGYDWGGTSGLFSRCMHTYIPVERLKEYCEGESAGGAFKHFFIDSISNIATNIEIPIGTTSIRNSAFASSRSIESVIIPSSVETIGNNSFQDCYRLSNIDIQYGVKSIGFKAFSDTRIREVSIPDSVGTLGDYAFQGCKLLEEIELGIGITTISDWTFYGCYNLKHVGCPSVANINSYAFSECSSLKNISFGSNVLSIGNYAFQGCGQLQTCDFSNNTIVPTLAGTAAFSGLYNLNIIVPDELYDEWVASTNWSYFSGRIKKKSEYYAQNN